MLYGMGRATPSDNVVDKTLRNGRRGRSGRVGVMSPSYLTLGGLMWKVFPSTASMATFSSFINTSFTIIVIIN